jgi:hypothetical protein
MDHDECCSLLAQWVADRLKKRCHDHKQAPPKQVQEYATWLKDKLGNPDYGQAPAPPAVIAYVTKTIEDPDWGPGAALGN